MPFLSPICESEIAQSCLTLSDTMDCSLPGSSVHGMCQARVLEWGAIALGSKIFGVWLIRFLLSKLNASGLSQAGIH